MGLEAHYFTKGRYNYYVSPQGVTIRDSSGSHKGVFPGNSVRNEDLKSARTKDSVLLLLSKEPYVGNGASILFIRGNDVCQVRDPQYMGKNNLSSLAEDSIAGMLSEGESEGSTITPPPREPAYKGSSKSQSDKVKRPSSPQQPRTLGSVYPVK
jgi:hypothetical protein